MTVDDLDYISFELIWEPIPQEFANGRILGYRVRVWELRLIDMKPNITNVDNTTTRVLIGGLQPNTRYMVNVSAFTSEGEGNNASLLVITYKGNTSLTGLDNQRCQQALDTRAAGRWLEPWFM